MPLQLPQFQLGPRNRLGGPPRTPGNPARPGQMTAFKAGAKPKGAPGATGAAGKALAQGNALIGPDAFAGQTEELYARLAGSPMFQAILKGAAQNASQANTGIQSALGRTGLSQSGIGAAVGGLGSSLQGNAINQAQGDLFSQAQQITLQSLLARLGITPELIQLGRRGPSVGQQLLGAVGGAVRH